MKYQQLALLVAAAGLYFAWRNSQILAATQIAGAGQNAPAMTGAGQSTFASGAIISDPILM